MDQVSFTEMKHGTKEEYQFLNTFDPFGPDEIIAGCHALMRQMAGDKIGYKIDRYDHSLQSATRAHRDGRDEQYVVGALLHDIGDVLAPDNHSQFAASIVRPYVSEEVHWIVQHHGLFQGYYFFHHIGGDQNARDAFKGHKYYASCAEFCEKYDQNSFDPDYENMTWEDFTPIMQRVFAKPLHPFA